MLMASMTAWGFCELAVLSRDTNGFPCTWRDRIGKSLRISAIVRIFWSVPVNVSYVIIMFPLARHLEIRLLVSGLERCPACHPERSEGSLRPSSQTLRCAQGDRHYLQMSTRRQEFLHLCSSCAILHVQRGRARRYGTSPLACSFHKR